MLHSEKLQMKKHNHLQLLLFLLRVIVKYKLEIQNERRYKINKISPKT